ncbi:unnamed protein product [Peronospora belbahrii]|uniref:Uncharacterized protein n=1 Tax=Peronospora belbahrii TaxID=622444 RepID=A0ABN8CXG4_9STRA|nr:unnamed protein product [Peronospora belbahrii]
MVRDFEIKQRGLLLMAMDQVVDQAIKKQSEMLKDIRTKNIGLVNWIRDEAKMDLAVTYFTKLRNHFESGQPNTLCSNFEALLPEHSNATRSRTK